MANFNLNKVILGGRITADPEVKTTTSGVAVCNFTIAVNRKAKDNAQLSDFISCQAWRQTAEFIGKYFKKGSSICVVGSIQTRSWTDKDNKTNKATDVVVDEVMFVDGKNDSQGTGTSTPTNYIPDAYKTPQTAKFEAMATDENLPF